MYFLVAFFVSIGIFVTSFLSSMSVVVDKSQERITKQNLNLIGRGVVNFMEIEKGDNLNNMNMKFVINEEDYLDDAAEMLYPAELLGGIFYYENSICVISISSKKHIKTEISVIGMSETNIRNTINGMFNYIVNQSDKQYEMNMAEEAEEDLYDSEFFNVLETNTMFFIAQRDNEIIFSGHHICFHYDN